MTLSDEVLGFALELGFDAVAIIPMTAPTSGAAFSEWLAAGHHGEMAYMAARVATRLDPQALAPSARSMIVTLVNYHAGEPPDGWADPLRGRIARYAWSQDYHDAIKASLFRVDAFIRDRTRRADHGKACVDTAPVLERDFAAQAGLGFFGRNTCLITPGLGSWTFLAALLVPEALDPGIVAQEGWRESEEAVIPLMQGLAARGTCGRCTRCLDACPTSAFVSPHVLDARRCISYLTIEQRGPIPKELRPLMGNWVFGCDVCQEVCPYNRKAPLVDPAILSPMVDPAPLLTDLLALDEAAFRQRYRKTAVLRAKRRGLVRNACVAAGKAGDPALTPALIRLLTDGEPLVRGHAAWALGRIGGRDGMAALRRALEMEGDAYVASEIAGGLSSQADTQTDSYK
jgi:epoxyqueuosine reductase